MEPADWSCPEIKAVGRKYALEAFNLADELCARGADAAQLLKSYKELDMTRSRTVVLPAMLADAIMAVLLSLPRRKEDPDQPLAANVVALPKRLKWNGRAS